MAEIAASNASSMKPAGSPSLTVRAVLGVEGSIDNLWPCGRCGCGAVAHAYDDPGQRCLCGRCAGYRLHD
jgi:hypothetical protein